MSILVHGVAVAGEPFEFPELTYDEDEETQRAFIAAAATVVPAAIEAGGFAQGDQLQVVASGQPGRGFSLTLTKLPEEA